MSKKQRKRRSFWEPDSPALIKWLDEQNELGTSLQLIIVDAIHKYGEGDVIKAHLSQREQQYYSNEAAAPVTPKTPVSTPPVAPVQQAEPTYVEQPTIEDNIGEMELEVSEVYEQQEQKEVQPAVSSQPIQQQQQQPRQEQPRQEPVQSSNETTFDISSELSKIEQSRQEPPRQPSAPEPEEEEYDPIATMLNDAGSRLRR